MAIDDDDDVSLLEEVPAPQATSTPSAAKSAAAAGEEAEEEVDEDLLDLDAEDDEEPETQQYRDVAAKAVNKWVLPVTLEDGGKLVQGRQKDKQDPDKTTPGSWDCFRTGLMMNVASGKFGTFPAISFALKRGTGVIFPQSEADQETIWKACKALVVPGYRYNVKKQSNAEPMAQGTMRVEGWILEFVQTSER